MKMIHKLKVFLFCTLLGISVASCDDSLAEIGGAQQNYNNAFGLIKANSNLVLFNKAIARTNLEATLDTNDDYTYFVPSDGAFEAFLVANGYVNTLGYPDINLVPVAVLKEIVLSHIVKGAKKRVGKLDGVEADYLETGELNTLANAENPDLYPLGIDVSGGVLKVNESSKAAVGLDYYGTNGFVHILDNVISLIPPDPIISSLSQAFASPGDVITITGKHFVKVTSIKFGDKAATFTPVSKTEVKVTVPADFGSYALIQLETAFGTSNIATLGVKYLLYGDSLPGYSWGWGGDITQQSTEKVSRGTYAFKKVAGPWSGLFIGFNDTLKTADYQFLKISVFATESTKILVSLNSDTNDSLGTTVTLKAGEWNNLSIPISDLKPDKIGATFNNLFIKEYSNVVTEVTPQTSIIYLDDIGFL